MKQCFVRNIIAEAKMEKSTTTVEFRGWPEKGFSIWKNEIPP